MSAFNYQALDKDGKLVKGVLEGDSEKQIRAALRSRQLKPTRISASAHARKPGNGVLHNILKKPVSLPAKELAILTRQLASLVRSGLPLDEALQITANQSRKEMVCSLLLQVRSRVTEGKSLAQALSEHPR